MTRLKWIDLLRGTKIRKVLRDLKVQQYMPANELDHIRTGQLRALFEKAKRSTAYYSDFNSYEELPVLTKQVVNKNFSKFLSKEYRKNVFLKETGGSTGTPLIYYATSYSQSHMWAAIILAWEVAGYQSGDKVAFIAGSSLFKSNWKHTLFYKLLNVNVYSAFSLDDKRVIEYIAKIKRTRAKIIYGYANAIGVIADYINRTAPVSFPDLKGIVSTAEILTDTVRQNIEKAFKVKVFNQYGCNEAGLSAFECEFNGMHLINSRSYWELGENGHLVSTDLTNEAYIMMKYDTGDIVEFSEKQSCDCRRNFPIINKVVGRSNDIVIDANRKMLHSAFFDHLFRKDPNIRQFQVTFDRESITVNLQIDNFPEDFNYSLYLDIIKKHLEFKNYNVVINAPFLTSENAKHKYVINNYS